MVARQLEHSTQVPTGAFYDDMITMIFAFHAFEAYLNYVGDRLAPHVWKDERNYFRKEPYRGFDGKIRKVLELCEIAEPDRLTRPYSTVWLLKDLRDLIAHGKTEKIAQLIEHSHDEEAPWMRTPLDALVTNDNAHRAHDDIKLVAHQINDAARPKIEDVWFSHMPFEGVLQHSERSSKSAT